MAAQKSPRPPQSSVPVTFQNFVEKFPAVCEAHQQVAKVVDAAGPLDRKTCELIKVGICLGGNLESALRSHVSRAIRHGATEAEVEQAILLAMNTCGFPQTVAAWQWAHKQIQRDERELA